MNKILAALVPVMLLTLLISGCSHRGTDAQAIPPIDSVTVRTLDGKGVVVLVMRTYDQALGLEDIDQIKADAQNILGSEYESEGPKISSSPELSDGARVVAFAYAVYSDRIPNSFWGTAGNENSGEPVFRHAQEWFIQELAGTEHP